MQSPRANLNLPVALIARASRFALLLLPFLTYSLRAEIPTLSLNIVKNSKGAFVCCVGEVEKSPLEIAEWLKAQLASHGECNVEALFNKDVPLGFVLEVKSAVEAVLIKDLDMFIIFGQTETQEGGGQIILQPLMLGKNVIRKLLSYRPPMSPPIEFKFSDPTQPTMPSSSSLQQTTNTP